MNHAPAAVILNPNASDAAGEQMTSLLERRDDGVDLFVTETRDDGRNAVRDALDAGARRLVAAGGDGTVHLVANVLLDEDATEEVSLGIVPCGTGNDLPRTLDLPTDMADALVVALGAHVRALDVLRLSSKSRILYAVNAAAGGFSGDVDAEVSAEQKARWGPLAFLLGAAQVLPDLDSYEMHLSVDGGPAEVMQAINVVLANGRTIGGGKEVAPTADAFDGWMDVVVVRRGSLTELTGVGTKLLTGNWLEHELVEHRRAQHVRIDGPPAMLFNADGELWANGTVDATLVPGALSVAVPNAHDS